MAISTAPVRRLVFAIRTGVKISLHFSVIADPCLAKLLYLPLEGLRDSSECRFFDPD